MTDRLPLFAGFGVELEYMIVDAASLDVAPRADLLLHEDGEIVSEIETNDLAWSNELVSHVIELKTNGPARELAHLADRFQSDVREIDRRLAPHGLRLMPTAMHPWMDPHRETVLWPHEYGPVYEAFHRIFDCRGHGWANLQSTHLNLPFSSDEEFRRLHAAVRLVLPLIPALAASSPIVDGAFAGALDSRLVVYRGNARRVPSVSGLVIPEAVDSEDHYRTSILARIYADMAPHDPDGILRYEWVNARGAIARFERGTIEIRLIDIQEHPAADLAILAAIVGVLRALTDEVPSGFDVQHEIGVEPLAQLLLETTTAGESAVIGDRSYLEALAVPGRGSVTAGEVWAHLIDAHLAADPAYGEWRDPLEIILREGCLARRIVRRLGNGWDRAALVQTYRALSDCLSQGTPFRAAP